MPFDKRRPQSIAQQIVLPVEVLVLTVTVMPFEVSDKGNVTLDFFPYKFFVVSFTL
jgi:hypothetical protein